MIKVVADHKNRFFHDERVREFEKINEKFEELVKKGVAKKEAINCSLPPMLILSRVFVHILREIFKSEERS